MSTIIIIPARYASLRLPGKPLLRETGRPLIQHVVENAGAAELIDEVVVATDDQRIFDAVEGFSGRAIMTRADHSNGTERLAEAVELLGLVDDDIVVNVQGDEPDILPEMIDALVEILRCGNQPMATLCTPLPGELAKDPNRVKVVFCEDRDNDSGENLGGRALYFSRSPIPFDRGSRGDVKYFLHLGIYAYRVSFLKIYANLAPTPLQQAESLEQLRALEHGYSIAIQSVDYEGNGIDTPEDYAEFVRRCKLVKNG